MNESKARAAGYVPEPCDLCKGRRVYEMVDFGSPTGKRVQDPCSACNGTGRVWTMHPAPALGPRYSDTELEELLRAKK